MGVWDDNVTFDQSLSPDHEVQAFRIIQKGSLFSVGLIWTFNHYYWAINQDPKLSQVFDCHFLHRWTSVLCSVFTLWIKCDDSLEIPEPAPRRILLHAHYSYKSFNYSRPHAFYFPALRNESFFFFFGPSHMQNLKKKIHNCCCGAICSVIRSYGVLTMLVLLTPLMAPKAFSAGLWSQKNGLHSSQGHHHEVSLLQTTGGNVGLNDSTDTVGSSRPCKNKWEHQHLALQH